MIHCVFTCASVALLLPLRSLSSAVVKRRRGPLAGAAPPLMEDTADLVINGELVNHGFGAVINNTVHQSAAGIPSLVIPVGLTEDGLPVGLSFDGPPGSDRRLLAIGKAFERLRCEFPRPGV